MKIFSEISERLKGFREYLNHSQGEIAILSGVLQKDISRMETGEAKYLVDGYIQYLYSRGLNVNWLLFGEGDMLIEGKVWGENPIFSLHQTNSGQTNEGQKLLPVEGFKQRINLPPVIIEYNGSEKNFPPVKMVSQQAAAGYPSSYSEPAFWEDLPEARLPFLQLRSGFYIMVQITGDSMLPVIHHGDWLIARYIDNIDEIREGYVHAVVTRDGIVAKQVLNRIKKREALALKSFNYQYYPTYDQPVADILQIWRAEYYISASFSNPAEDIHKRLNRLESEMVEVRHLLSENR